MMSAGPNALRENVPLIICVYCHLNVVNLFAHTKTINDKIFITNSCVYYKVLCSFFHFSILALSSASGTNMSALRGALLKGSVRSL